MTRILFITALTTPILMASSTGCVNVVPGGDGDPPEFTAASAVAGGAMYDKWWAVAGTAEPTEDHPFWVDRPDQDSNARTGSTTWRCKECHGWDYKGVDGAYGGGSHRTGFAGLFGTTASPQEAFDSIKTDHGFGAAGLSDDDIWDLAKFALEGTIDTDDILTGAAFTGSAATGMALYESVCTACHGVDGLAVPPGAGADHEDFVGLIATENPWEFQHKVRFGQPGTAMPPQVNLLTLDDLNDLSAYAQTLPASMGGDVDPAEFSSADGVRGGAMYDKWWVVVGLTAPTDDHSFWAGRPDQDSNARTGGDTWRCKECHGWDYKGVDGAYGSGSHRTGFAGLFGTTASAQEAFDTIKTDHGFGAVGLSDDDIWDLAKFALEGTIDTDDILTDAAFTGSAATGMTLYASACMACHGADGLAIPPGAAPDYGDFVSLIANENPWEFQHKVRFGQPATIMPPQANVLTLEEVNDLSAHAQTLPIAP